MILYTSALMDKDGNRNTPNLCDPANIEIITSGYFKQNEGILVDCDPIVLGNNQNVKYFYSIRLQNVTQPTGRVTGESVIFRIRSGPQQVFHFYNYQLYTVWDSEDVVLNEASMFPRHHSLGQDRRGRFYFIFTLSIAYKGSDPVIERFDMQPYYYENYFTGNITRGYLVEYVGYEESSSLRPKSYLNFSNDGAQNGFAILFLFDQSTRVRRISYGTYFGITDAVGLIAVFFMLMILPMDYIKSKFDTESFVGSEIEMEESKSDPDGGMPIVGRATE